MQSSGDVFRKVLPGPKILAEAMLLAQAYRRLMLWYTMNHLGGRQVSAEDRFRLGVERCSVSVAGAGRR
ncbi:protein of unknown function [Methylocaldum szegediense]|uniref:Uncharacterized protein n=1 Tax=Methylocaldum szegediense TaxID=73780 RepID=A0ABM9I3Y4_9GAMM|nr:protein of unknown function [Methylocaldum szegediense]